MQIYYIFCERASIPLSSRRQRPRKYLLFGAFFASHCPFSSVMGSVMVSSRREIICSRTCRTWENYKNIWESTTPQLWRKLALFSSWKICVKWGWQLTRPLRFVAIVHLPFSFRSLDPFVASLLFMKGTSCCVIRQNKSCIVRSCYSKFFKTEVTGLHDFHCLYLHVALSSLTPL